MSSNPPPMVVEHVRRPGIELLAELAVHDFDVFGPTGLRAVDLALVAWTGRLYVGRVDGRVVASCQLLRMLDRPHMVWIVGLYVLPRWQGRGLGRLMLDWVLRELASFGATGVELTVVPENTRALQLYRSAGFHQIDEVQEMYGADEHRIMLRYDVKGAG
jgi:ribosomal protein S18 acetylase RimI-like enzyme